MDEVIIVIMLKDNATGFLEKELCSITINENDSMIVNAYAEQKDDTRIILKLTTFRDVLDWEFDAVYDAYDAAIFQQLAGIDKVTEVEDTYNPTWELTFPYTDPQSLADILKKILQIHKEELDDVFEVIKEQKENYI